MFNSLLKTIGVEDNDGAGEGGNETSSSGAAAPPVADAGADAGAAPRGPPREDQQQQQRAPSNQRRWPLGIYRGGHEEGEADGDGARGEEVADARAAALLASFPPYGSHVEAVVVSGGPASEGGGGGSDADPAGAGAGGAGEPPQSQPQPSVASSLAGDVSLPSSAVPAKPRRGAAGDDGASVASTAASTSAAPTEEWGDGPYGSDASALSAGTSRRGRRGGGAAASSATSGGAGSGLGASSPGGTSPLGTHVAAAAVTGGPWDGTDELGLWRVAPAPAGPGPVPRDGKGAGSDSDDDDDDRAGAGTEGGANQWYSYPGARPQGGYYGGLRDWSAASAWASASDSAPAGGDRRSSFRHHSRQSSGISIDEILGGADSDESGEDGGRTEGGGAAGTRPRARPGAGALGSGSAYDATDDDPFLSRRHWMPDRLCRNCYACEVPFTVFRRRHHCRLCGQVFCSVCSGHFVEAGGDATAVQPQLTPPPSSPPALGGAADGDASHPDGKGSPSRGDGPGPSKGAPGTGGAPAGISTPGRRTVRICEMCFGHVKKKGGKLWGVDASPNLGVQVPHRPHGPQDQRQPPGHRQDAAGRGLEEKRTDGKDAADVQQSLVQLLPSPRGENTTPKVEEEGGSAIEADAVSDGGSRSSRDGDEPGEDAVQRFDEFERKERERLAEAEAGGGGIYHQRMDPLPPTSEVMSEAAVAASNSGDLTSRIAVEERGSEAGALKAGIMEANRQMGLMAANLLEKMGRELMLSDAPILLEDIGYFRPSRSGAGHQEGGPTAVDRSRGEDRLARWIDILMLHASRCVATVEPNVKNGDLLDIRPYCKVKVIPGGSLADCAYMSGVIFHKNVSHKSMAKEIIDPRIMLLSGGIEYTRTENRIASLDTLLEQEEKYMEILVNKIIKLKPDLLIVGRSVSRKAQELLVVANVVLIQHIKPSLMGRIARQTGATILSSTDHVMNQFGTSVLGTCKRFRLVTFRDNDSWSGGRKEDEGEGTQYNPMLRALNINDLLAQKELPNYRRQAVLAASKLGEGVLDGSDAVRSGLAKRGVALTYTMIEGCPKDLGCTIVLRGASRPALKQVKRVFRFIVNIAYNLRLETSYLRERCAMLPPNCSLPSIPTVSSSLCVDYGNPPQGRKVRPWNGGKPDPSQRSISGKITAMDHQSILITSVWMTGKNQCCPAEVKGIRYYSLQDVSLGQFLRDSCFNLNLKCQNPSCKKTVLDHSLSFIHNDSLINITVEDMDNPLPPAPDGSDTASTAQDEKNPTGKPVDKPIATWTYCVKCGKVVTPLVFISEDTWKLSFGKFLETFFYNRTALLNSPEHNCSCQLQTSSTLYFGCGQLAARFTYEKIRPFGVFIRKQLPFEMDFHRNDTLKQLQEISVNSSQLFLRFDKHIERISRDARQLFGSAANRPEHLQTVVSELNAIGSEVTHAAKTLQEKISSVTSRFHASSAEEAELGNLLRVPWQSRRYLFMLTSAWNERLSAVGKTLTAMKKLSSANAGSRELGPSNTGDGAYDEVMDAIKHLKKLADLYSQYNHDIFDSNIQLPHSQPNVQGGDARRIVDDTEYHDEADDIVLDYDEDFTDDYPADQDVDYFPDSVDADVVASRRRVQNMQAASNATVHAKRNSDSGTKGNRSSPTSSNLDGSDAQSMSKPVTAGGAVKSALTRLFNRGNKDHDLWKVDLGILGKGRPRLEPGSGGLVVPVFDGQPSTIVAYSLSSAEYENQFKYFAKSAGRPDGSGTTSIDGNERAIEEIFTGGDISTTAEVSQPGAIDKPSLRRGGGAKSSFGSTGGKSSQSRSGSVQGSGERKDIERQMLARTKTHIKHTFRDFDHEGQPICKFVCTTYWATQFHAVRQAFLTISSSNGGSSDKGHSMQGSGAPAFDIDSSYIRSLSSAYSWAVSGGKSGASFSRTDDGRFIVKCISRTELQMFLDCAPAYFEYLSKACFHGLPTVLCKIVGVYQIGYHNRVTGKRTMEQVAVMQNIFHGKKISRVFDLKGSLRGRFTQQRSSSDISQQGGDSKSANPRSGSSQDMTGLDSPAGAAAAADAGGDDSNSDSNVDDGVTAGLHISPGVMGPSVPTLLDGDFLEFTGGRPLPLNDRAKAVFHMSILNDTLFLSIINVLDYSILVGIDEENMELVVGIIDFMRQYDILKQMERVGKSLPMVVGSEAPTIIQPPLYKSRFTNAMERYFMTVPSKWTTI